MPMSSLRTILSSNHVHTVEEPTRFHLELSLRILTYIMHYLYSFGRTVSRFVVNLCSPNSSFRFGMLRYSKDVDSTKTGAYQNSDLRFLVKLLYTVDSHFALCSHSACHSRWLDAVCCCCNPAYRRLKPGVIVSQSKVNSAFLHS